MYFPNTDQVIVFKNVSSINNQTDELIGMVSRITTTKVSIPGLTDEHQQPQKVEWTLQLLLALYHC